LRAQAVVLKDGSRISADDLKIAKGRFPRQITAARKRKPSCRRFHRPLEWANPKSLSTAQPHGRRQAKEAIALLQQKNFFRPFKDIKGNPYNEIVFANVEALDQAATSTAAQNHA